MTTSETITPKVSPEAVPETTLNVAGGIMAEAVTVEYVQESPYLAHLQRLATMLSPDDTDPYTFSD